MRTSGRAPDGSRFTEGSHNNDNDHQLAVLPLQQWRSQRPHPRISQKSPESRATGAPSRPPLPKKCLPSGDSIFSSVTATISSRQACQPAPQGSLRCSLQFSSECGQIHRQSAEPLHAWHTAGCQSLKRCPTPARSWAPNLGLQGKEEQTVKR
jgi:hypothetical protein